MKVVCFVCLFFFFGAHTSKSPNHGASCQALGIGGKPLMCKVVPSWFHNVLTYNGEVMNIERKKKSLKIYLNKNQKIRIWTALIFFLKKKKKPSMSRI
jgi:hypothetical protein